MVLVHGVLLESARYERIVVLEEIVGSDAHNVYGFADDMLRFRPPEVPPELFLVLLEVLNLLPQGNHLLQRRTSESVVH